MGEWKPQTFWRMFYWGFGLLYAGLLLFVLYTRGVGPDWLLWPTSILLGLGFGLILGARYQPAMARLILTILVLRELRRRS